MVNEVDVVVDIVPGARIIVVTQLLFTVTPPNCMYTFDSKKIPPIQTSYQFIESYSFHKDNTEVVSWVYGQLKDDDRPVKQ